MTRSPAPRPRSVRCVARVHFHLAEHPDAETVYAQLLGLVEDVTPASNHIPMTMPPISNSPALWPTSAGPRPRSPKFSSSARPRSTGCAPRWGSARTESNRFVDSCSSPERNSLAAAVIVAGLPASSSVVAGHSGHLGAGEPHGLLSHPHAERR